MYNCGRKKIIGSLLVVGLLFSVSFAKDDCQNINANPSGVWDFESLLPKTDLEIARNHLRSYCCVEKPKLAELSGKCENLVLGPESPYWYDHLIDVGMRRLDAESLYPNMTVDSDGKIWREFMKKPENITNPQVFLNTYKQNWSLQAGYLFSKQALETRPNFESLKTLHDKYLNYCLVSYWIYKDMGLANLDLIFDGYYDSCLNMVKARIRQETVLAMNISQYQSSSLLLDGLTSYTKMFGQDRLMKLYDKLVAISSLFDILARQAPLSPTCVK